jgi:hypothetical protein
MSLLELLFRLEFKNLWGLPQPELKPSEKIFAQKTKKLSF